jgi:hypothetical protein
MDDDTGHDVGDRRAARDVDDMLDDLVDGRRPGGVRRAGLDTAVGGAAPPGHHGPRPLHGLLEDVQGGPAGDRAIDPSVPDRDRTLHGKDILTAVLLHRLAEHLLGLDPGGGLQYLGKF